jgi:hypothetical protein
VQLSVLPKKVKNKLMHQQNFEIKQRGRERG